VVEVGPATLFRAFGNGVVGSAPGLLGDLSELKLKAELVVPPGVNEEEFLLKLGMLVNRLLADRERVFTNFCGDAANGLLVFSLG
jgi:hypothetical protein